jgi:hypothetical protein
LRKRGQRSDVPVDSGPTNSVSNVFDDEDSSDHGSDHDEVEVDVAYTAESPGRDLGPQPVPRFDLDRLKVWEVMFVDNKEFPCVIRGGATQSLLFVDVKSRMKAAIEIKSKKLNGTAFRQIVSRNGIHKVQYSCRVYSDGCGSMVHVKNVLSTWVSIMRMCRLTSRV